MGAFEIKFEVFTKEYAEVQPVGENERLLKSHWQGKLYKIEKRFFSQKNSYPYF